MEANSTASTNFAKSLLLLAVAIVVWRAATLPVTAIEAIAWDRFVRPPVSSLPTMPSAWSGIVYGIVARRAAGLFRLSEFSLRAPGVLGFLLYCCALFRICRGRTWLFVPFIIPGILLNWFNLAGSFGLAVGFTALALAYPTWAGPLLGFAIASGPQIGFVPAIAAAALLYLFGMRKAIDRVVIPAIGIAFVILIIPVSHGGWPLPQPATPTAKDEAFRSAVDVLRSEAGQGSTPLFVTPAATPLLEFYRARYRQRNWLPGAPNPQFFLGVTPEWPTRTILFEREGVVLAR